MPSSGISHNLMATTLTPVDSREVVRCDRCQLVQFRTTNNLCRRCRTSLDNDEPEVPVAQDAAAPPAGPNSHPQIQVGVAHAIRSLRLRTGLSQRQLALRMQVPRTYVSKIENEKATPTLSSLERLARALEVRITDLLNGGTRSPQDEIRELMADDFIAQLVPYVSKLNGMQWASILAQVRDMTQNTHVSV